MSGTIATTAQRWERAEARRLAEAAAEERDARYLAMAAGAAASPLWGGAGDPPARRWHVLCVWQSMERELAQALDDLGVECWCPSEAVEIRVRGARRACRTISRSVWPGYLFVRVVPCAEAWAGLRSLHPVAGVLGGADGPLALADGAVEALRALVESGAASAPADARPAIGSLVAVLAEGAMGSFPAVVEGYRNGSKVRVLASMFGRETLVEIDIGRLAKPNGQ